MDGKIGVETLIFLLIAVVLIWRLRSVLGRRTGDDQARYERAKAEQAKRAEAAQQSDKIVTLPRRGPVPEPAPATGEERFRESAEQRIRKFAGENAALAANLVDILRIDASFDPDGFLRGARQAYEMIVSAFALGDKKTLKGLLSADVFEGFARAIADRDQRGERIEQSFVGINRADLVEFELKGSTAQLTVKFVSELITTTLDKAGQILSGDPKRINEVTDIWTFARDLSSRDPNWKLVATEAAG